MTASAAASEVRIRRALAEDRLPIARMLELYQYELSDIWDQDLDLHGEYGYALDRYWQDPACRPYIVGVAGHPAGFALVDAALKVGHTGCWMDQFFILKKYRRRGLGRALAWHVFDALPGPWEVGQMAANTAAQRFWRRLIADYSGGHYTEHSLAAGWWQGQVQCFNSAARPPAPASAG